MLGNCGLCGTIYKPLNTNAEHHSVILNTLELCLQNIGQKQCILSGDTKLNLADLGSIHVSNFTEIMFDNFFFLTINEPTRFSKKSATISDQIWSNIHSLPIKSGSILSPLSDHLPIYMSVTFIQPKSEKLKQI